MREELDRHYPAPVLWLPARDGGLALVPDDDVARLPGILREVELAAGAPILAGIAEAQPETVAEAAPLAREVLEVVRALGRRRGGFQLQDVALEFQLLRESPALTVLAACLDPLEGAPALLETLQRYTATGLNRRKTATQLGVHPNTVDNRLQRIAVLVGLDPQQAGDLPRLNAALAARARLRGLG
jgi:sugar diacid utilization regulator